MISLSTNPPRLAVMFAGALFIAGIGFILFRSIISPRPEIDFRYFWLAGYLWNHGLDPYSPTFSELSRTVLPDGNQPTVWVYPPHWWLICRVLAAFSLDQAVALWRLLSGAMLITSTWFLAQTLFANRGRTATVIAAGAAGLVCLIEPTSTLLTLGQSSAVIYLGVCLLVIGSIRASTWLDVAAIVLLSLKPQVGVPMILGLLIVRRYWLPIAIAAAIGLVLALPQLISFSPLATAQKLLANISGYSEQGLDAASNPNSPLSCTGLINLLAHIFPSISLFAGYVISIVAALVVGFLMSRADRSSDLKYLLLLVCTAVALVPLHVYDLSLLVIPLLMLCRISRSLGLVGLAAIVLAVRPAKIEEILHVPLSGGGAAGAILLSVAALLLAVLATAASLRDRRQPT